MFEEHKTINSPTSPLLITLIQIFLILFCFGLHKIFYDASMLTIIFQNKLPENFLELNDLEQKETQQRIIKEIQEKALIDQNSLMEEYVHLTIVESPSLLIVLNIGWLLCFVFPGYWFLKKILRVPVNNLSDPISFDEIIKGIISGISIFVLIQVLSLFFNLIHLKKPEINYFQSQLLTNIKDNPYLLAWSVYTIGVITGILEEVFFRGFLLTHFMVSAQVRAGLIITSVVFGAMHFSTDASPVVPVILTLVGFAFGFIYIKSNNIWTSITAHATYNSLGLILAYFIGDTLK